MPDWSCAILYTFLLSALTAAVAFLRALALHREDALALIRAEHESHLASERAREAKQK